MSKMTDEQIKKGLECCADLYDCTDCPCKEFCGDLGMLQQNALDLINRQQAQLEYMQGERETLLEDMQVRNNQVIEQQAEIEDYRRNIKQLTETLTGGNGLRIRVDNMIVYADDLEEWLEFCDKQKSETIKELEAKIHEKLHEAEMHGNFEPVVTREMFDSVVKEMVGEGK